MKQISILLTIQLFIQLGMTINMENFKLVGDVWVSKDKPISGVRSFSQGAQKWTNGIVPYVFDAASNMNNAEKQAILTGMATISQKTNNCIRFVPRTTEKAYVSYYALGGGCSSYVGRLPDSFQPQRISIERPGCFYQGAIIHETLHALGFQHEHERPDRDNYINIDWSNVQDAYKSWFDKSDARTDSPYDIKSIMHYVWNAGCKDCSKPTMTAKNSNVKIGTEDVLTNLDVQKIMQYYGCQSSATFPTGKVALKARVNSKYVSADNSGSSSLIANRDKADTWETFQLIKNNDGTASLKALVNNKFVTAENYGNEPLIANRDAVDTWEKFDVIKNSDGSYSFKARVNGKYVTAENYGNDALIANRDGIDLWEKFSIEIM